MTCVNLQVACLGWYRENQPMSTDERKIAKGIFFINKYHWFVISDSTMKINKTKKKKNVITVFQTLHMRRGCKKINR